MIDNGILTRNPLARIKSLKEVHRLLSKTKETYPDFYPLLFTALFTGMRESELLVLTWNSINWVEHKIKVDKSFSHNRLGPTKTNQIHYVDVSKELVRVLRKWQFANIPNEKELVFPNTVDNYQNAKKMTDRRFKPSLENAGIEDIRFHDLRHTGASVLLASGAPMKYVQHQLGHVSITMTMNQYTHLLPEITNKCANLIDNIIKYLI